MAHFGSGALTQARSTDPRNDRICITSLCPRQSVLPILLPACLMPPANSLRLFVSLIVDYDGTGQPYWRAPRPPLSSVHAAVAERVASDHDLLYALLRAKLTVIVQIIAGEPQALATREFREPPPLVRVKRLEFVNAEFNWGARVSCLPKDQTHPRRWMFQQTTGNS